MRALVLCAATVVAPSRYVLAVDIVLLAPALFLRHHRGLHDLAASTIVVADPQRR